MGIHKDLEYQWDLVDHMLDFLLLKMNLKEKCLDVLLGFLRMYMVMLLIVCPYKLENNILEEKRLHQIYALLKLY